METLKLNKERKYTVLGLMSGTSMDGLDCGLFYIELTKKYDYKWKCIKFKTYNYTDRIRQLINESIFIKDPQIVNKAHEVLGKYYAKVAKMFTKGIKLDLIASHGQTISHLHGISTKQIGNPQYLYNNFKIPIVYDFRQEDIKYKGCGAPLMPFLDWLLFKEYNQDVICLNIGGIANLSFIPKDGNLKHIQGFDTGPGMSLIDEATLYFFNKKIDLNGLYSKKGKVNKLLLKMLMEIRYIHKNPPKSTGRDEFGYNLISGFINEFKDIKSYDIIRTLCAFTAKSISENISKFLNITNTKGVIIISGGGAHHPVVVNDLVKYANKYKVKFSDSFDINKDMKESLLIATLGIAKIKNISSNIPSVTGAKKRVVLGSIYKGEK